MRSTERLNSQAWRSSKHRGKRPVVRFVRFIRFVSSDAMPTPLSYYHTH